jgi:hypothetical protein
MHKIWSLISHRVVWTIGAAWLAGVAAQAVLGLVLKSLGLLHGASLHTWLLDVGHNMGPLGAAGGLGAAAAAAAAASDPPPPKDKDPDPCASQAEDVLKASGTVDMLKGQLQSVESQIDALMGPINAAAANAAALASDVHTEVAEQAAITVVTKVIQGLMAVMDPPSEFAGAAVEVADKLANPVGAVLNETVPGYEGASEAAENVSFFNEMNQYFQAYQGNIEALQELANEYNMPTVQKFVNQMNEMNGEIDKGQALFNKINNPNNGIQQQLDEAQGALKDAQAALKACQDSNAGGGSSGGAGSGGGDSGGGGSGGSDAGADD